MGARGKLIVLGPTKHSHYSFFFDIIVVLFLVNYTSREFLYCSSGNLLDSIYETSTPFCTISGIYIIIAIIIATVELR